MKFTVKELKNIIKEELQATLREVRIEDSGFKIGDRVKYEGHGAVGDGIIIDMEQDGVNYHGGRDTSPTANPRTILVIQWEDGKVKRVPSQHIMHFDEVYPRG